MEDTDPRAQAVQLELLRQAGVEKRAILAGRLADEVIAMSRRALRERSPAGTTEIELRLRWVELNYGADLAARVRGFLATRSR